MNTTAELVQQVRGLPIGPAYAPIYAIGTKFGKHNDVSTGKAPHEQAYYRKFSPADVALLIEDQPDKFVAIGIYTGIRSDGIVILDVDANLANLKRKWGKSLDGAPCVVSTKRNAAKFLFRVPESERNQVKGITGRQTNKGYEVLWGMQGVILGAYPGNADKKAPPGEYKLLSGDFHDIPVAPEWLLAEMRARKVADAPAEIKGLVRNRKGLDFSGRTDDEVAEIVHDCLAVLPHLGRGSEDYWWQVGAMIAEALPNDLGLTLWSAWSANDEAFEDEWARGNPCEAKWRHILSRAGRSGNAGLGSLIAQADRFDPLRQRFQDSSRKTLEEVEETQVQLVQQVALNFSEVIKQARDLLKLDNPAEMNYSLHALALRSGYKDKESLERLLIDQMQYENAADTMSLNELLEQEYKRYYIVPDLIANPSVTLLYGAGGDGKSMTAWALAKHIAMGIPFVIRGRGVPVEQGPVLLLNGDQPLVQLQEQMEEIEMPKDAPVTIRTDWSLQRYAQFVKLLEVVKPKLVVIDSLIGCSGGKAFDENKSDFATPLYWLTRNNGVLFPATSIIIIHHANKQGGFRGTSAIRDAVDEVWSLKKPTERELETVGGSARIITIEKSRSGRSGSQLLLKQENDLTFTLADWTPEVDPAETSPSSITDRVLQRLRVVHPAGRTRAELNADPVCGGSVAAIRKALQRLVKRGLVTAAAAGSDSGAPGKPALAYTAVLSRRRGDFISKCPTKADPNQRNGSEMGQPMGQIESVPSDSALVRTISESAHDQPESDGTLTRGTGGCPIHEPLQQLESGAVGQITEALRVREAEAGDWSVRDLDASLDAAGEFWD